MTAHLPENFRSHGKTFSEKLAKNTADRMLLDSSFALTAFFFLEEEGESKWGLKL